MSTASKAKRLMYLAHRWTGIAGCLLMLLWFVSGIIMLYVGYPKLTPWERLAALPELDARQCCAILSEPPLAELDTTHTIVLTSIRGAPAYTAKVGGKPRAYDGATGRPLASPVSAEQALDAAVDFVSRGWGQTTFAARALRPHGKGGLTPIPIKEDRWT